ncbi:F0F1 ATP synthase subunit delta [Coprobacillus sp. AM29-13]|jgi:F-type H+-transporting ATPase subunit delta|uniref:F0F1 ATP synthase subunit delta n=1 Tax=Faecalibacillus intestinalis TaxID=1982626 RepID=UPI000E4BD4F5|nr:F0F1 ATP synthase subunit delta [Faecalibacillus intestinalis]RGG05694.1 F0F1 ATP synthase subunit delta [Coprobacillus sp. AF27-24BH]RGG95923.1 F0F1 ATP synthase subunit delta [Coprobacillus sp. AF16-47]RGH50987.1 F0F1 ATP synthase subunit delta [Coprobacillus sp. AM37-9BH]RGI24584.1 F0F1 ATP synthase subunit delta [Coprobacillus sp. OM08-19]RHQ19973.1 F0F1 ATP synthase subunit delta [Coprobacillus sp. AF29-3BH]RHR19210.1 F0F1 ATP synthase subunit delta [Coprobacillus sp. AF19-3]RHT51940
MSVVGDRYAESLFDLAKEENKVTQYLDDIKLVGEVLDSDPQIVQFFNHVLIENDKKIQLLDQSFKGNVDQYVLNFLKLLVQSRRIRYIDDIVKSYIKLSNQYLGIEEGMIYTPYELTDQQIQDIEKAISQKENKKVTLKVSIDPSLLGGIKVQISNRIYDGTIKNKVEMLKKELLRK